MHCNTQRAASGRISLRPAVTSSAGTRPALVVSDDRFNDSTAGLVLLCSLTTTERPGIPWHIAVGDDAGLPERSFIMCEQVRSASKQRLSDRIGTVPASVMQKVKDRLQVLMAL